jgi:hypothetical protein
MGQPNLRPQRMLVYPQLLRLRAHRVVEVGYPAWIARFLEVVPDAPDLIVPAPHLEQMGDHLAREAAVLLVGLGAGTQRGLALGVPAIEAFCKGRIDCVPAGRSNTVPVS